MAQNPNPRRRNPRDEAIKKGLIKAAVPITAAVLAGPKGAAIGGVLASGAADVLYEMGVAFTEATGWDCTIDPGK